MSHAVNWFEIPAANLDRAAAFYEHALGRPLKREVFGDARMAIFVKGDDEIGGALIAKPNAAPADGVLVYLNAENNLDGVLARVPAAGGTVVLPKLDIAPHGFIAHVRDTEGNLIGLHALR